MGLFKSVSQLSIEDYFSDQKAFFDSVHNTLNHLLLVDILYRSRIIDHGFSSSDQILYPDLITMSENRIQEDLELINLIENLRKV